MLHYENRYAILLKCLRRNTQVWLKGSVLKTDRGVKARGGSNPSSSAINMRIKFGDINGMKNRYIM